MAHLKQQIGIGAAVALASGAAFGQDDAAELAKKLSNPIASLISVPLKVNWDTGIGPAGADKTTFLVQPVVPFAVTPEWNVIVRTILPYVDAQSPVAGGSSVKGFGDTLQSFFFSPKAPTAGGWIWGAGPAFQWATASKSQLGGKWGIGPTAVVLKQEHGWTYGALANHVWSFAGGGGSADVNATFVQPFLAYATKSATTFTVNTESTYDWTANQWTVPVNLIASQLMRFGQQPVSFALGYRHYVERPANGPDWGLSFTFTLLFPK